MTETRIVSIDEVRALVAERQRYDDWLTALDARRDATPVRVFERVYGDYVARRSDVMTRLREHVGALTTLGGDLDSRLDSLQSRLGALEDERAEAMLRTAVGEFDSDRWEQVRQDVEAQIAELEEQRTALQTEGDEVRTLLTSARSEPEVEATATAEVPIEESAALETHDDLAQAAVAATETQAEVVEPVVEGLVEEAMTTSAIAPSADDLAEFDNALALFSNDAPNGSFAAPAPVITTPLMDGLDVFDDSELGDLRMAPPARATATATPPASNNVGDA
ncbi:MAG: hypothetical protein ABMA00_18720, partial [Gemmatimonas sp.]